MTKLSLVSFVLAGCLATGDETQLDQQATTVVWQATLHCGGQGVVVDVNRDERRDLQAVVRDPAAVAWLAGHPGDGGAGVPNAKHEIIVRGSVTRGVFSPADFSGFDQVGFSVADALLPEAHVARDGSGLRVRLVSWASGHEIETANWWFADCR
jgi:hypothetical protein